MMNFKYYRTMIKMDLENLILTFIIKVIRTIIIMIKLLIIN